METPDTFHTVVVVAEVHEEIDMADALSKALALGKMGEGLE